MAVVDLKDLLHPRVLKHCEQLYVDGHYKHAAHEAMTQVELALKERVPYGGKKLYGVRLVRELLGQGRGIKLLVPFGDEMQGYAATLFEGAFKYYRNYTAHDGSKVDRKASLRAMVLASELLELIGASDLSFADAGGAEGLVRAEVFPDKQSVTALLDFIDGQQLLDDDLDCIRDDLYARGFDELQLEAIIDTGLVDYVSEEVAPPPPELLGEPWLDTIGHFHLTELGKKVLAGGGPGNPLPKQGDQLQ